MPYSPHPNVRVGLLATLLACTFGSIAIVRDAYVLKLPDGVGSATRVGIMEGICGMVALCCSGVMGVAVDRIGRSRAAAGGRGPARAARAAARACLVQAARCA